MIALIAQQSAKTRATYCTRLIEAGLTDSEIAGLMAWGEQRVGEIRKRYVDDAAIVVALGRRLAGPAGKRIGKRRA